VSRIRILDVGFLLFLVAACSFGFVAPRPQSTTPGFIGQVGYKTAGLYEEVNETPSLRISNGLLRLVLYCMMDGTVVTMPDTGSNKTVYRWCDSVPYTVGERLLIEGTLITPSEAGLTFIGDLYVFKLTILG
jgi:hypothetical protein